MNTHTHTHTHRLQYDPATGEYGEPDGIQTRVPGFGNTSGVEYLDPHAKFLEPIQYFHAMVQHFVDKGYVRGENIVSAPYDWRYSPSTFIIIRTNTITCSLVRIITR